MNALTNGAEDRPCNRKVYTGCRGPEGCVVLVGRRNRRAQSPRPLPGAPQPQPYRVRMGRRLPSGLTRGAAAARRNWRSPFSQNTLARIALH
jgi:hypothetical protein